jgi:hypothetical protein
MRFWRRTAIPFRLHFAHNFRSFGQPSQRDFLADYRNHKRHLRFARSLPACGEACRATGDRLIFELSDECERRKTDPAYSSQFLLDFWHDEVTRERWGGEGGSATKGGNEGQETAEKELKGVRYTLRPSVMNLLFDYYGSDI